MIEWNEASLAAFAGAFAVIIIVVAVEVAVCALLRRKANPKTRSSLRLGDDHFYIVPAAEYSAMKSAVENYERTRHRLLRSIHRLER